jgi:hypothetical protein
MALIYRRLTCVRSVANDVARPLLVGCCIRTRGNAT